MARGGYRPGAGRKKGKKTDLQNNPEKLVLLSKAEEFAIFYKGILARAAQGKKPTAAESQKMQQLAAELTKTYESGGENEGKPIEELLPLEFMLKLMNDASNDLEMRARMAQAAAPYCHARKGDGVGGKKEEQAGKAKQAGAGKFAPGRPPIALVK
jgi:hypothetical protein